VSSQNKSSDDGELFGVVAMGAILLVATVLFVPLFLISLPMASALSEVIKEKNGLFKYGVTLFVFALIYGVMFGVPGLYEGTFFTLFRGTSEELFYWVMNELPGKLGEKFSYPVSFKKYLWPSFPVGVLSSLVFNYRDSKKKKNSRELFEREAGSAFSGFIFYASSLSYPYFFVAKKLSALCRRSFSSNLRSRVFFFLSLSVFYFSVYLTFGNPLSWYMKFGYLLNKAMVIFEYVNPVLVGIIKEYFFLGALLSPVIMYLRRDELSLSVSNEPVIVKEKNNQGVYVGMDQRSDPVMLSDSQLNHHMHVVGASGFGKTTFLLNVIKEKIDRGEGVIFVDLKGDIDTVCEITTYAYEAGRLDEFDFFSISEDFLEVSKGIALFDTGNAVEIKDKIMGAFSYDNEYYKKRIESFLNLSLRALVNLRDQSGIPFDLDSIYELLLGFEYLEDLKEKVSDPIIKRDLESLIADKRLKEDLTGLKSDIEGLMKTDFGSLISSSGEINLYNSMRDSRIVYLHLDSQRYETSAERLGKIILQDIKAASAKIVTTATKAERAPITLIVDEFANLATEQFVGFLNRARASNIGIIVAHQELSDLEVFSPVVRDQIMTNTSTLVSFLQKLPASAEMIAGIGGTYRTEKETSQINEEGLLFKTTEKTGMGSLREVEEYVIHPNLIKELSPGECFMISKYPRHKISKVFVNFLNYQHMNKDELLFVLEKINGKRQREEIEQNTPIEAVDSQGDWL